jgi:transposase
MVAMQVVKLACERPDERGVPVAQWDSAAIARQLETEGLVGSISAETVRRVLLHHKLKPWRQHAWLSAQVPRNAAFAQQVQAIIDHYTRPLAPWEAVLCLDEMTNLQPRPRLAPTRAARPRRPVQVEHAYRRAGALHLFAAFDTRTGRVYGQTARRKRQVECIAFLEQLDRELPPSLTLVHLVLDNVRMHKGQLVQAWLAAHPRFVCRFPPVHCSWMNQIEQWFSILQRKRLRIVDFPTLEALADRLHAFIAHWNARAHPFRWSTKSVAKVMAACTEDDTDEQEAA